MDIDNILGAIEKVDRDRDLITLAIGSHLDIEGSTGESKFCLCSGINCFH